jgi:hypothetical protein
MERAWQLAAWTELVYADKNAVDELVKPTSEIVWLEELLRIRS